MSIPKHRTAPGSSYFVTTKCWQNRALFQVPETAEIIIQTLYEYRERSVYLLHEFVVMPDHLHLLLTPGPTTRLEKAMQFIKGGGSHRIHQLRSHEMEIWQWGFHDWTIRDAEDWRQKSQYIRNNPVVAKLVESPEKWPYSSANPRFAVDPIPERFQSPASGAKALSSSPLLRQS